MLTGALPLQQQNQERRSKMKFLVFSVFDVVKAAEIAQASDKVAEIPGGKMLTQYSCQGIPFVGVPPNKMVVVSIADYESNEAIAASQYPLAIAGASTWAVPVLEMPADGAATEEKKYRK
jgi:hypothetical protein